MKTVCVVSNLNKIGNVEIENNFGPLSKQL